MFTLPNQLNSVNNSFNKLLKLNTNSPEYAKLRLSMSASYN